MPLRRRLRQREPIWEDGEASKASGLAESKLHDAVFNDLMQECKHSAPGARLSARLRTALERMRPEERRAVCGRTREGCAPLFVAARRGNVELVEYLVHVCAADLEQRGLYEVSDDRSTHSVTPLWCAAVAGQLEVVRVLADAGADVDAGSDSGSTPVRSACFMTHVDVVRLLVARGADIHRANHNGGTCLINSVQSARLCAYLLARGAAVDAADMQLKTALHYAIQEHRFETAKLLLEHGADPLLVSRAGDDALRTACLKGAAQIVSLLLSRVSYSAARRADAYELLGATHLDEFNDVGAALAAWRRATAIRHSAEGYIEKRSADGAAPPELQGVREWREWAELEAAATDVDRMRLLALLVAARVLGLAHKDTVFRLMYRGAAYADAQRYRRCMELWTWALRIRIERDPVLYAADTCQTACALTKLMLDAHFNRLERAHDVPAYRDVHRVYTLLVRALPVCRSVLCARPLHKKQAETFDKALRCVTYLLHLLLATADDEQRAEVRALCGELLRLQLRSAHTGDTLLHLAVSRLNMMPSNCFTEDGAAPQAVFPSAAVAQLLLASGASARVRNEARSTPLHVAAVPYNFRNDLVHTLLRAGAHLDQPNRFGDSAADLVAVNRASRVRLLQHVTLACLAARAHLASGRPTPPRLLPRHLYDFLDLHRP